MEKINLINFINITIRYPRGERRRRQGRRGGWLKVGSESSGGLWCTEVDERNRGKIGGSFGEAEDPLAV